MRKWFEPTNRAQVLLWLKALCSILLLIFLLRLIDWRAVSGALRDAYAGWFLLAALANILQLVLSAWRWKMLLFVALGERLSLVALLRYYFIGGLFNNFVPANLGSDALRAGVMLQQLQNKAVAVGSVIVERILNLAGLLSLAAWAIWFQILPVSLDIPAFWLIGGILAGLLALAVLLWIGYRPPRFVQSSIHHLANFWHSCRKQPDAVALIGLLTLLQHVAMMLITFCTFRAVGVALPVALHLAIYAIAGLALTVPLTIQGIGVREGVYIGLMTLSGVQAAETLAALALNYAILLGFSGLGALLLWLSPASVKPQPG